MKSWMLIFLTLPCLTPTSGQHLLNIPESRFLSAYFIGEQAFGTPLLVREDTQVDFDWGMQSPDPTVPVDNFSARWLGRFAFEAGTYTFQLQAAGGVRLRINGTPHLDTWESLNTERTLTLSLAAGHHVIDVQYRHHQATAAIALYWQQASLLEPCQPLPNQFCVSIYDQPDMTQPANFNRRSAHIRSDWHNGEPFSNQADPFAVTWAGDIGFSGATYRFWGTFNGNLELHLNDTLFFSAPDTGQLQNFSAEVATAAGLQQLRATYQHFTGTSDIDIQWRAINQDHAAAGLGINIHQLTYWSPEWTLLDAFKSAGGWFTQTDFQFDTFEQDQLDVDTQGWVRRLPDDSSTSTYRYVAALILNGNGAKHPPGQYIVTYDGEGEIEYFFDAVKVARLSRPGRHVLQLDQPTNGGILLRITQTDPRGVGNYIRNLRVIMPGYRCAADPFLWVTNPEDCPGGSSSATAFAEIEPDQAFHPAFLQNVRQYKAIRHMDFLATNSSTVNTWESRSQLDTSRYLFDKGAPPELAIDMPVFLGSDVWLNIPDQATDDYVIKLAQYALEHLAPHQRVTIEYSNEVWNLIFPQGNWIQEQGQAQWPNDPTDPYFKRINWYGKRANELIGLWKSVWGDQATRVTGVMGGQLSNETIAEVALDCPLWAAENGGQDCTQHIDALTIAPYFGGYFGSSEYYEQVSSWITEGQDEALDRLFKDLTQGGLLPNGQSGLAQAIGWMAQAKATATRYNLDFVAYEGGQHLVGVGALINDDQLTALFNAANRDVRMTAIYETYLEAWRNTGGALFCLWISMSSFDRFGNWGIQEAMDDTDNPKYLAVQNFIENTPCWWANCRPQPQ